MPPKSVRMEILNTLQHLEEENFEKFRFQLCNPAEKPSIKAAEVEKKSCVEITKLLVSRCTESGALDRTIRTLGEIGCNNEAQELESRTKARSDKEDSSISEPGPSPKLPTVRANKGPKISQKVKKVMTKAKKTLKFEKTKLLLGKCKEKSIKWLRDRRSLCCCGGQSPEREGGSWE